MTGTVIAYQYYIPADAGARQRNSEAYATWKASGARLFPYSAELTSKHIGDPRACPFVSDIINAAFESGPERTVIITNNDIIFGDGLGHAIRDSCDRHGCYWAYRTPHLGGDPDGGLDLFAMTKGWWEHAQIFWPDLLLGYSWWDNILRRIMIWSGCPEGPRLYFHRPHPGIELRRQSRGEIYNQNTAREWLRQHQEPE